MKRPEIIYAGVLEGHRDSVYALAAGPESRIFFSAGGDGMIVRWQLDGNGVGEVIARLPAAIYSLCYHAESNFLFAGCRFGGLYVLDIGSGRQVGLVQLDGDVFGLCYMEGRHTMAAATASGKVYIIRTDDYTVQHEYYPAPQSARCLALSPGGKYLAGGWSDGFIRVFDLDAEVQVNQFQANQPSVFALLFQADGKRLLSGGRDARLRVWDAEHQFAELKEIPAHLFTVNKIIPVPSLGLIATASRDKTVKIWDDATYDLLKVIDRPKLPAHTHSVNTLLWPGFNDYLLSAGDDKSIKTWGIFCG